MLKIIVLLRFLLQAPFLPLRLLTIDLVILKKLFCVSNIIQLKTRFGTFKQT